MRYQENCRGIGGKNHQILQTNIYIKPGHTPVHVLYQFQSKICKSTLDTGVKGSWHSSYAQFHKTVLHYSEDPPLHQDFWNAVAIESRHIQHRGQPVPILLLIERWAMRSCEADIIDGLSPRSPRRQVTILYYSMVQIGGSSKVLLFTASWLAELSFLVGGWECPIT